MVQRVFTVITADLSSHLTQVQAELARRGAGRRGVAARLEVALGNFRSDGQGRVLIPETASHKIEDTSGLVPVRPKLSPRSSPRSRHLLVTLVVQLQQSQGRGTESSNPQFLRTSCISRGHWNAFTSSALEERTLSVEATVPDSGFSEWVSSLAWVKSHRSPPRSSKGHVPCTRCANASMTAKARMPEAAPYAAC